MMNFMRSWQWTLVVGLAGVCTSCGPHMISQPSIQPYGSRMPAPASGTVPTGGSLDALEAVQTQAGSNPVASTPRNIRDGEIYYGYYCLACHGHRGDGNGPVGESYDPKPTDLRLPEVTGLSDSELYSRMLHGTGHDPVLSKTVIPEHRWPIVLYVRTLTQRPERQD